MTTLVGMTQSGNSQHARKQWYSRVDAQTAFEKLATSFVLIKLFGTPLKYLDSINSSMNKTALVQYP